MSSYLALADDFLEKLDPIIQSPDGSQGHDFPHNVATVMIAKSEYEDLLRSAREYSMSILSTKCQIRSFTSEEKGQYDLEQQRPMSNWMSDNLKASLLTGGLPQETLDLLVQGPNYAPEVAGQDSQASTGEAFATVKSDIHKQSYPSACHEYITGLTKSESRATSQYENKHLLEVPSRQYSVENDASSFSSDDKDACSGSSRNEKHSVACTEKRTVVIHGLSDRTTHHDIAAVVRGGALLDIFLRARERTVNVSFVAGSAAKDFLDYARRQDIYVSGKRVEVSWSDRQFYLPSYVRSAISKGASRNLVIRGVNPNITEALIREDLDHIHNLIIVSVTFTQGNAYISTNSVHNAMFARSCMISRATYKGMKIGFLPDECAGPVPRDSTPMKSKPLLPVKKADRPSNRYQLLAVDGVDDLEDDSDDGLSSYTPLGSGISWSDNTVSA